MLEKEIEASNLFGELEVAELQQLSSKYGHDSDSLRFCHHCKQFKRRVIFAKCNFASQRHKMVYPNSVTVNGVKIYNAEGHQRKLMDCLTLKKLVKDKKRRKTYEEQLDLRCDQHFCSLCLKNFYDVSLEEIDENPEWLCPYCTGACFCSRCRRLEQLTTATAYLISLNLERLLFSPDRSDTVFDSQLQRSRNIIDRFILDSFNRIVKTCDLSSTGQVSSL